MFRKKLEKLLKTLVSFIKLLSAEMKSFRRVKVRVPPENAIKIHLTFHWAPINETASRNRSWFRNLAHISQRKIITVAFSLSPPLSLSLSFCLFLSLYIHSSRLSHFVGPLIKSRVRLMERSLRHDSERNNNSRPIIASYYYASYPVM